MGVVEQDDVDIEDLDDDDINDYKKQARKVTKSLNKWGIVKAAPAGRVNKKLRVHLANNPKGKFIQGRRFSDICVMVINSKGKGRMIRCLLDSGCSKSIILKKFTDKNQRTKLSDED